jgi:hypothetical protein
MNATDCCDLNCASSDTTMQECTDFCDCEERAPELVYQIAHAILVVLISSTPVAMLAVLFQFGYKKVEKADVLAVNIALQRLKIAIESFELQKGAFTTVMADSMPCAADSFHQLVDCFWAAVKMLEIEENGGETLENVPFKIEKQQRYFWAVLLHKHLLLMDELLKNSQQSKLLVAIENLLGSRSFLSANMRESSATVTNDTKTSVHNINENIKLAKKNKIVGFTTITVSYIVVMLYILCASWYIVTYALQYGSTATKMWLNSFVTSFTLDMFVISPYNIVVKSVILLPLIRRIVPAAVDFISYMYDSPDIFGASTFIAETVFGRIKRKVTQRMTQLETKVKVSARRMTQFGSKIVPIHELKRSEEDKDDLIDNSTTETHNIEGRGEDKNVSVDDSVHDRDDPVDNSMNFIRKLDEIKGVPIDIARIVPMRGPPMNETIKQMKVSDKGDTADHSMDEIRWPDEVEGASIDIARVVSMRGKRKNSVVLPPINTTIEQIKGFHEDDPVDHSMSEIRRLEDDLIDNFIAVAQNIEGQGEDKDISIDDSVDDIKRRGEPTYDPVDITTIVPMRGPPMNETLKQMKVSDKDGAIDHSMDEIRRPDEVEGASIDIARIVPMRGKRKNSVVLPFMNETIEQMKGSDSS